MVDITMETFAEETSTPTDSVPPTSDVEYPCRVCGKEAGPYSGRGRKPTLCADCKGNRGRSAVTRSSGKNSATARQAAQILVMGNHLAGAGLGIVIGSNTQDAIISAQDTFYEAAVKALEADPVLAKQICGGGAMSGKAALVIAYAVMAVGIFPVAKMEIDAKIQARKERQLANESGT